MKAELKQERDKKLALRNEMARREAKGADVHGQNDYDMIQLERIRSCYSDYESRSPRKQVQVCSVDFHTTLCISRRCGVPRKIPAGQNVIKMFIHDTDKSKTNLEEGNKQDVKAFLDIIPEDNEAYLYGTTISSGKEGFLGQ